MWSSGESRGIESEAYSELSLSRDVRSGASFAPASPLPAACCAATAAALTSESLHRYKNTSSSVGTEYLAMRSAGAPSSSSLPPRMRPTQSACAASSM